VNNAALQAILGSKVVELSFVRRHPKLGWSNIRSLLGTTNYELLNGDFGSQVLLFQPPIGVGMGYNYKAKGLCVVWDILRQDYRVFGSEQVVIKQQWDLDTEEDQEIFKQYFYDNIIHMSNQAKIDFMGYVGMPAAIIPNKPKTVSPHTPAQPTIGAKIKDKFDGFFKRVRSWFDRKK